ncbi:hypothetical protein CXF35_00760 [Corynebacterium bovis]|uniref:Uncharacterized protein n=1 Tax=Corynebacterium bovis TaxID=36808 RepID=A0A3R8PJY0_9CORY|nr:hypothetical protein [Corynebacterium bovis]RRO92649.1 hypothetical protein CXF40_02945 [Corynebacterium bovis]RRO98632.1 hypothetical protein CXF32_00345 [Corynebacterium bovis]RRO99675.1 hypothetical protein CXF41_08945 [Corynebacterium bovis]RRQ00577.1 hypothetical protein CXF31_00450 [Corynebacterium bovis]RRQ03541.1 hypothetical protein CXF42_06975 [Corynebacterium bovis]
MLSSSRVRLRSDQSVKKRRTKRLGKCAPWASILLEELNYVMLGQRLLETVCFLNEMGIETWDGSRHFKIPD